MTFVSLAQAARRLGIDAKTLHRWLADAQLALQSHPHDGRKKGVSSEHLHLLAHLIFPAPPSAPLVCQWSIFRRTHQYWAGYYHRRRRHKAG